MKDHFRAGDHVKHGPSGESWVLACDEERGRVMPAGWPESMADAADCTLTKAATERERRDMLTRVAASRSDGPSYRRSLASHQLTLLREPPTP